MALPLGPCDCFCENENKWHIPQPEKTIVDASCCASSLNELHRTTAQTYRLLHRNITFRSTSSDCRLQDNIPSSDRSHKSCCCFCNHAKQRQKFTIHLCVCDSVLCFARHPFYFFACHRRRGETSCTDCDRSTSSCEPLGVTARVTLPIRHLQPQRFLHVTGAGRCGTERTGQDLRTQHHLPPPAITDQILACGTLWVLLTRPRAKRTAAAAK